MIRKYWFISLSLTVLLFSYFFSLREESLLPSSVDHSHRFSERERKLWEKDLVVELSEGEVEWLEEKAGEDPLSQIELFLRYWNGWAVVGSRERALFFLNQAVSREHVLAQMYLGQLHEEGSLDSSSDQKALYYYTKAAEGGWVEGYILLGNFLARERESGQSDYEKAFFWYKKAAESGEARGQYALGSLYQEGLGVERSWEEAIGWYRKAAEKEEAKALFTLGFLHEKGEGLEQSYEKAAEFYQRAADRGSLDAMYFLAILYENGWGVPLSLEKSFLYHLQAAEGGLQNAWNDLGYMYQHGIGTTPSMNKAAFYYQKAAEDGNAIAQVNVGILYEEGSGVERSDQKARYYYQQSAKQKEPLGLFHLGRCFESGLGGEQSYQRARYYYRSAGERGFYRAYFSLALLYHKGLGGEQSYEKAADFYKRALEKSGGAAEYHLAYLYENGLGVGKDLRLAVEYYEKAETQGYTAPLQSNLNQLYGVREREDDWIERLSPHLSSRALQIVQDKRSEANFKMDNVEGVRLRKWLDTLRSVPFGKYAKASLPQLANEAEVRSYLDRVRIDLDEAVYGHHQAKEKILELVGSWIRKGKIEGGVIGIQGYPGTGKTALITRGLVKALQRPYSFIALGGKHDGNFLAGTDDVYISSHHGKILESLIETGCMNPILYFDELDKVSSRSERGAEILDLLIHLTDPLQNMHFQDNYLRDIDLDLSSVLSIFSFNDESILPPALKDRMVIIHTDPPTPKEKVTIATQFLFPEAIEQIGFTTEEILIERSAIKWIVNHYTREVGVRHLGEALRVLLRKVNLRQLQEASAFPLPHTLREREVRELLGEPEEPLRESDLEDYYLYLLEKTPLSSTQKTSLTRKITLSKQTHQEGLAARKWLDQFFKIPFGVYYRESFFQGEESLSAAEQLQLVEEKLEGAVYGHQKSKHLLLSVLSEWMTKGEGSGLVLGLQGPPGNGKSTLALKGIQEALGRPFHLIPLGGISRAEVLAGTDEVFVGSHCGQIAQALIETQCMDPILYFDELDKVGQGPMGRDEVYAILTHLTDSTQNNQFRDHYFRGIDLDLSRALFIFSYNDPAAIDPILLDRMTSISVEELSEREKLVIARDYLLPDFYRQFSLSQEEFFLSEENLLFLIRHHTYEAGVRQLRQHLYTLFREVNLGKVRGEKWSEPFSPSQEEIDFFLKKMRYPKRALSQEPQVGVIQGLSANMMGPGSSFPIQLSKILSDKNLEIHCTGSVRAVIRESVQVAKVAAWNLLSSKEQRAIQALPPFGIHVHFFDAATPKDGPSAGAALTVAIYSLLKGLPIPPDIALTGEVDMTGRITAIGGLRSKLLAAKSTGIRTVYIPEENVGELPLIEEREPDLLDDSFQVRPVNRVGQLVEAIFQ